MNEMRKLIDVIAEGLDSTEVEHVAYAAANIYHRAPRGTTKPALAKQLSEQIINLDLDTAMLIIYAIDAFEDIRET